MNVFTVLIMLMFYFVFGMGIFVKYVCLKVNSLNVGGMLPLISNYLILLEN